MASRIFTLQESVPAARSTRWLCFDLLRGVAILGVVLFHAWLPIFRGGELGVDLFFTISGFLLTYLFLTKRNEWEAGAFFRRRFARIFPPLFAMLFVAVIAYFALVNLLPKIRMENPWLAFLAAATSWMNFLRGNDIVKNTGSFVGHTWSLSLEEQFYVFLGVTFAVFQKLPRVIYGICVAIYAFFLWQFWWPLAGQGVIYQLTFNRIYNLFAGVVAAIAYFEIYGGRIAPALSSRARTRRGVEWAVLAALLLFFQIVPAPLSLETAFPLTGVLGVAAIFLLFRENTGVATGPLVLLGRRSYSIYLWHSLVQNVLTATAMPKAFKGLIFLGLTALLSELSYRYVEPLAARHFRRKSKTA